ncbi:hypothetical protein [Planktothrix prolifica]|uniref:hypothetical protein n=1 Tax=Planktothrix prolifica TaxID=54307 RepID=UPI0005C6A76A|nr:hypothetical protein [Planktothrix prolifica]
MSNLREYLDKNPQQAKRLLGMEYEQLIELIQAAELLEQEKRQEQGLLLKLIIIIFLNLIY